ncbi:hypothetical protein CROQUDRAFT_685030 [Cronartium quercuum f. sp. fusiforme G11]|uniref:Uncharacterized protein n=1 Tax=Cronartium quercuum f. sp. fusiforme G11 TaxID=708437 RepID=A0A9P6N843_9BASI|nr:hypothetical protein CROQUDRAFT_685030 [Cronartium quercuum f. sp. fusiforme G11]
MRPLKWPFPNFLLRIKCMWTKCQSICIGNMAWMWCHTSPKIPPMLIYTLSDIMLSVTLNSWKHPLSLFKLKVLSLMKMKMMWYNIH